jgi:hypothetical protein
MALIRAGGRARAAKLRDEGIELAAVG